MISDVTAVLMRISRPICRIGSPVPSAGRPSGSNAAASPAQGFTVARRAAMLALMRVFRRFFLPYRPNPS